VGASTPEWLQVAGIVPVRITARGRECRQMCRPDRVGFPRTGAKGSRRVLGFQTGDQVRAVVPVPSITAGTSMGRLAVRATGSCNRTTGGGTVQGIHLRSCLTLHRADGYSYQYQKGAAALPPQA
jgi:hypothetical protein